MVMAEQIALVSPCQIDQEFMTALVVKSFWTSHDEDGTADSVANRRLDSRQVHTSAGVNRKNSHKLADYLCMQAAIAKCQKER
jgi:hypothetical protein